MSRTHPEYSLVTLSSSLLVQAYRVTLDMEDSDTSLAVVHFRGGRTEFDLGALYAASNDPLDRDTGAQVLAQLGWGDDTFHDESVAILIRLLGDKNERVISAAIALGHRHDPIAIPSLLPLATHASADVRHGAVFGLSRHEDSSAVAALISLTKDEDYDVRNWAAFGLAQQSILIRPSYATPLRVSWWTKMRKSGARP